MPDKKDDSNKSRHAHILKYYVAIKGNTYEDFLITVKNIYAIM